MKRKLFNLASGTKQAGTVLALTLIAGHCISQQSWTFTPCGATGGAGPTQTQANSTYSTGNSLNGSVTITGQGIQQFTVPISGNYIIEAQGARGYNPGGHGGRGASVIGEFSLTAGTVLKIAVGQAGQVNPGLGTAQYGGGGGSFVSLLNNTPLLVAGGGGASHMGSYSPTSADGTVTTSGNTGSGSSAGVGGIGGAGGAAISSANGGAGFYGNGGGTTGPAQSFTNGAVGGNVGAVAYAQGAIGGFGGGGGSQSYNNARAGGGGGYSGGGGASLGTSLWGGGGGSYNNGTNQTNISGANTFSDGVVIITEACSISLTVTGLNANGELCEGQSITISTDAVSNYSWTDGSIGPVLVATPATSTVYGLTATSPSNCTSSAQVAIIVNPLPVLNATASSSVICLGKAAVITAGGADTYSWTTNATVSSITVTPSQTTTYSVTGTNTLTNCEFTEAVTINVVKPVVGIAGTSVICKGNTATLTAYGDGATSYNWSSGLAGQSLIDAPANHTIYVVSANIQTLNTTCPAMNSFTVTVNPLPNIVVNPDMFSMCVGETVNFTASGASSYTWYYGFETANSPNFAVTADEMASIVVNVTGTDANGCTNSSSVAVQAYACVGINETQPGNDIVNIYPNPSQGDINIASNMAMNGAELELLLFNETGQVVRKVQLNAANEYKTNITDMSSGIYFITGNNGEKRISSKITIAR